MTNSVLGKPFQRLAICWLAILAIVSMLSPQLQAQRVPFRGRIEVDGSAELMLAPRELRAVLEDAKEQAQRAAWAEASLGIGQILGLEENEAEDSSQDGSGGDFFLESSEGANEKPRNDGIPPATQSLKAAALQLLFSFPKEGAEVVELRYGAAAKRAFEEALRRVDPAAMRRVANRFPSTQSGRQATRWLAEWSIGQGQLEQGAQWLELLMEQPTAREQFGPSLGIWTAMLWRAAGQVDRAVDVGMKAQSLFVNADASWNGKPWKWGSDSDAIRQQLNQMDVGSLMAGRQAAQQWWQTNGRADGNGQGEVGQVLPLVQWDLPMHAAPQDSQAVMSVMREQFNDRSYGYPSRVPLVVGDYVVVRTYDQRTLGIDQRTGRIIWDSPYEGFPLRTVRNPLLEPMGDGGSVSIPEPLLRAVWAESVTGQLSSDGQCVFGVCSTSARQAADRMAADGAQAAMLGNDRSTSNVLRAWSISRQGAIQWEVGGEDGLGAEELAGAFFLGAPCIEGNRLHVLAEINGEVQLVELDPVTGNFKGAQSLVANSLLPIASDPMRRPLGATPAVHSGVILAPTLSGYLIAYDTTSETLRWAMQYGGATNAMQRMHVFGGQVRDGLDPLAPRSLETAPLVADGMVYFLPCEPDANGLFGIDLASGKILWTMARDALRMLAGAWDGKLLVLGDRSIQLLEGRTGKPVWRMMLGPNERLAGRGVRQANRYLLPTINQEILAIDLDTGKEVARYPVEGRLGHLIGVGGRLLSLSAMELSQYVLKERLTDELQSLKPEEAQSAAAGAKRAELALGQADYATAMNEARQALDKQPDDLASQWLMMKVAMAAMKADFEKYGELVEPYEELMAAGPDRTIYWTLMVRGLTQKKQWNSAWQRMLALTSESLRSAPSDPSAPGTMMLDRDWMIEHPRWVASQFEKIWESVGPNEQQQLAAQFDAWARELDRQSPMMRRRLIGAVGNLPPAEPFVERAARDAVAIEEWGMAEPLLWRLKDSADPQRAAWARETLAQQALQKDLKSIAVRSFGVDPQSIDPQKEIDPRLPTRDPMSKEDLIQWQRSLENWPRGHVMVEPMEGRFDLGAGGIPLDLEVQPGDLLDGWSLRWANNDLRLSNPWGQETLIGAIEFELRAGQDFNPAAYAWRQRIVLEMPQELVVIDASRLPEGEQAVLWRQTFGQEDPFVEGRGPRSGIEETIWGERIRKPGRDYRLLGANERGIFGFVGEELVCWDWTTGEKQWSRRWKGKTTQGAVDRNRLLLVDSNEGKRYQLDCRDGTIDLAGDWPTGWQWRAHHRGRILADQRSAEPNALGAFRLIDFDSGKSLLERTFAAGTIAGIGEQRAMVAWDTQGLLTFWDFATGRETQQQATAEKRLREVRLIRMANRWLVLPYSHAYDAPVEVFPSAKDPQYRMVAGPIYALDDEGKLAWQRGVKCYRMLFPLAQSKQSPLMVLVRRIKWPARDQGPRETTSIALLDLRTGQTVYNNHLLPMARGAQFSHRIHPSESVAWVGFGGQMLRVEWTDEETPPSPVSPVGMVNARTPLAAPAAALQNPGRGELEFGESGDLPVIPPLPRAR